VGLTQRNAADKPRKSVCYVEYPTGQAGSSTPSNWRRQLQIGGRLRASAGPMAVVAAQRGESRQVIGMWIDVVDRLVHPTGGLAGICTWYYLLVLTGTVRAAALVARNRSQAAIAAFRSAKVRVPLQSERRQSTSTP
jgi:hypothetical protein